MTTTSKALEDWLRDSVRDGYLFGCHDEPLDETGKRVVRAIIDRLAHADPPADARRAALRERQLEYLRGAVAEAVGYALTGDADADDAQLVDRLFALRDALSATSPSEATQCEGECNPYIASCGAWFCTYEAMSHHERQHKAAAPPAGEEQD